MDKIGRVQELVKKLNTYRDEYYNLNHPSVLDSTYDSLFDELSLLEKETGFILSNSPTQSVGYEVKSKLQKRTHPTPLKSLDKTKSIDELNKWRNNQEVILMLKADGLTVEIDYEDGLFVGAYTRGNGEIGEDITHNAKTFKNVPLQIPFLGKLRIVGEAVIHWNDFNDINSKLPEEEKYATPRNLVAGSVRQLDSKICAERNVYFYAFNILEYIEMTGSKWVNLNKLIDMGFTTVPFLNKDIDISEQTIVYMKKQASIQDIPIDGLVIAYDSVEYANSLGETSHHPLHSIAYKFSDETEESVLRSVEWNTTRSGQINPTAIFDTVILDNTEVSRASLFNLTFIKDMQLNFLNKIAVSKRNMIIPYIEENLDRQNGNYIPIPEVCPSCGAKTEIRNTGTADFLYCTNINCPAQLLDKFVNFVKRDGMNIEGLSEATLEKFINKGWLKTFDDIYHLEEHKTEIIKMDGFGLKSYNNLLESIEKSKKVKMENFVIALGIPNIGKSSSKVIAKYFGNDWWTFEEALCNDFDFTVLEDFGEITNNSLHNWYKNDIERKMWTKLTYIVSFVKEEKTESSLKDLTGLTFVVTGAVTTFKNRDEVGELITSLGGKLAGSVSKNTSYLLNNDVTSTSGKNQKAKELNVPIISEADFNLMIGRNI